MVMQSVTFAKAPGSYTNFISTCIFAVRLVFTFWVIELAGGSIYQTANKTTLFHFLENIEFCCNSPIIRLSVWILNLVYFNFIFTKLSTKLHTKSYNTFWTGEIG